MRLKIKFKFIKYILVLVVVVAIAVVLYFYERNIANQKLINSISTVSSFKFGVTNSCRPVPKFITSLKMGAPALDSRQQDGAMGLQIRDSYQKSRVWQHPSWELSGYIGSFDRDRYGNIYVLPLPYVSLQKNPLGEQNQLYVIDSQTATMELYVKLPTTNAPSLRNPFGVMGVYYDCDTDSLYVSSVAGTKPMQEAGVVYQIDAKTKKILSKLENTDAIGVGVFNTPKGKRLYFGSARNSNLFSIALDGKGNFVGKKKYELSLSQIKGGDTTVIKKISFIKKNKAYAMVIKETEFGFRLMAENRLNKKKYNFKWDNKSNKWIFGGFSKE